MADNRNNKKAMKEVPVPNIYAKQLVGVVKENGQIVGYQLSDGRIIDQAQSKAYARAGSMIEIDASSKNNEYLNYLPDDNYNPDIPR